MTCQNRELFGERLLNNGSKLYKMGSMGEQISSIIPVINF